MATNQDVVVSLLPINSNRKPESLVEPLELYLSHPVVQVTKFEIKKPRLEGARGEEMAYCDLEIAGTVNSVFASSTDGQTWTLGNGKLFVNGDDKAVHLFVVLGKKDSSGDARRPYRGSFSFTAEKVRVTDGNNVFQIKMEDEVFPFFGGSLWSVGFAFPWPPEPGEEPDPDAVKLPTITDPPTHRSGGGAGEGQLYTVAVRGIRPEQADSARLHLGIDKVISCRLVKNPAGDGYLAQSLESNDSLIVALRATDRKTGAEPNDKTVARLLAASDFAKLSYRSAFLHSYSVGLLAGGADFVAGPKQHAIRAVEVSSESKAVILHAHLNLADGSILELKSPIWPAAGEVKPLLAGNLKTAELLAYTMQLRRSKDPRAEEFTIAMLVGEFTDLGWDNVRAQDWCESLYSTIAETLEAGLEACTESSATDAGYYMGRFVGEALRLTSDPQSPTQVDKVLKSEFLPELIKARIFGGKVSAVESLIGKLKSLFRWG